MDTKMQSIQSSLVKGATAVTQLVEELAQLVSGPRTVDLQKVLDLGTDSLALLGNTNHLLNLIRRDLMKTDLKQDYLHLCSSTVPFTDERIIDVALHAQVEFIGGAPPVQLQPLRSIQCSKSEQYINYSELIKLLAKKIIKPSQHC